MADSSCASSGGTTIVEAQHEQGPAPPGVEKKPRSLQIPTESVVPDVPSPRTVTTPPPLFHHHSFEFDDYFKGPRDLSKHSKWPLFLQMHGSIVPKLLVPLFFVGVWSTLITVVSLKVHKLGVNSILLTVTGFVVSMALSFRTSTAYERYNDGRKYFASLQLASQALGRIFWIHCKDQPGQDPRKQMLKKISAMNLVVAYAVAVKHDLRFEPYTAYPDFQHLVAHLDTFARSATETMPPNGGVGKKSFFKRVGEYLGLSFAASNPRKLIKRAEKPLGNLPLEILNHIAVTIDMMIANGQLSVPAQQTIAFSNLAVLNDVLTGCERVLNTPLPLAFSIAITQITWVYVLLLPFQLVNFLNYITIPATVAASYIILGILMIGQEIENPFGSDVNDLPLDSYCEVIAHDMDVISSYVKGDPENFLMSPNNKPLYPVSSASVDAWMQRSEQKLRDAIRNKPRVTFQWTRWEKPMDLESGKMD